MYFISLSFHQIVLQKSFIEEERAVDEGQTMDHLKQYCTEYQYCCLQRYLLLMTCLIDYIVCQGLFYRLFPFLLK